MNKSDFVIVYEGKHAGLRTKSGEVVLPCDYDKIPDYDDDGYIRFIKDGVYGTIDLQGVIAIPLSEKLTHLGVFHKGTARAQKDGMWGLVDVKGKTIKDFMYKSMDAHRKYGYHVVTKEGKEGWLSEKGEFKTSTKKKPEPVYHLEFNESLFLEKLSPWLGDWLHPLQFFYRDTDAPVDVKKLYKKGLFVRTDCPLEVTQKLLRPVHKIRFLIASREFRKIYPNSREQEQMTTSPFKENWIPAHSHFLVVDVQSYGSVKQVVLLHFPHGAMLLAKKFDVKFTKYKPKDAEGITLKKAAESDLQLKMGDSVHGHSLDDEWVKAMFQPVGLDKDLHLNEIILHPYPDEWYNQTETVDLYCLQDVDKQWKEKDFMQQISDTVND